MECKRLQRSRLNRHIRDLLNEVSFCQKQLIQPLFIVEGLSRPSPITALPENFRETQESALRRIESDIQAGVTQFILFFIPKEKADKSFENQFASDTLKKIRQSIGDEAFFWVDTCLCSKTKSGHCCLFDSQGNIDLEATHRELSTFAVACGAAGANGIAPSDMIDGTVRAIRGALNQSRLDSVPILSYSTKFASNFYGPFRDAADSAPQFGDRKHYQLDVRNREAAIQSSVRYAEEGADLLMVKPGMSSIDLIEPIKARTNLPVGAYQVSGEFGGLSLLSEKNLLNFHQALLETWYTFRRAGASFVITYGARMAREVGI